LLYLVSEPLFYETELDSAVLARTILDAADKPRHVGDRPANDHRYLFLRNGIT
jgi:hypothetical protein